MSGEGKDLESPAESERVRQAYQMKLAGKSLSEIADELRYSSIGDVVQAIRWRLDVDVSSMTSEERQSILALEIARLDALQEGLWLSATLGDPRSVAMVLQIIAMRSKLLRLDVPDAVTGQQTVLVIGGQEKDYVEQLKELSNG